MLGSRAIWHDGWTAVTFHAPGTDWDDDPWELYHQAEDYSQAESWCDLILVEVQSIGDSHHHHHAGAVAPTLLALPALPIFRESRGDGACDPQCGRDEKREPTPDTSTRPPAVCPTTLGFPAVRDRSAFRSWSSASRSGRCSSSTHSPPKFR